MPAKNSTRRAYPLSVAEQPNVNERIGYHVLWPDEVDDRDPSCLSLFGLLGL